MNLRFLSLPLLALIWLAPLTVAPRAHANTCSIAEYNRERDAVEEAVLAFSDVEATNGNARVHAQSFLEKYGSADVRRLVNNLMSSDRPSAQRIAGEILRSYVDRGGVIILDGKKLTLGGEIPALVNTGDGFAIKTSAGQTPVSRGVARQFEFPTTTFRRSIKLDAASIDRNVGQDITITTLSGRTFSGTIVSKSVAGVFQMRIDGGGVEIVRSSRITSMVPKTAVSIGAVIPAELTLGLPDGRSKLLATDDSRYVSVKIDGIRTEAEFLGVTTERNGTKRARFQKPDGTEFAIEIGRPDWMSITASKPSTFYTARMGGTSQPTSRDDSIQTQVAQKDSVVTEVRGDRNSAKLTQARAILDAKTETDANALISKYYQMHGEYPPIFGADGKPTGGTLMRINGPYWAGYKDGGVDVVVFHPELQQLSLSPNPAKIPGPVSALPVSEKLPSSPNSDVTLVNGGKSVEVLPKIFSERSGGEYQKLTLVERQELARMTVEEANRYINQPNNDLRPSASRPLFERAKWAAADLLRSADYQNRAAKLTDRSGQPITSPVEVIRDSRGFPIGIRTEYLGKSLRSLAESYANGEPGAPTKAQFDQIRRQTMSLVEDLHAQRMLHGDLNPANIVVTFKNGSPKVYLIDFSPNPLRTQLSDQTFLGATFAEIDSTLARRGR